MLIKNSKGEGEGRKKKKNGGGGGGEDRTLSQASRKEWAELYECIK